jgi:adenylate cyclase
VLFADVVHSMDIAAAVGAERLREIMAELADRCAAVVQRYGGAVDKFTGDGIMAVFGAPVALEDHAIRACRAGLGIQEEAKGLAAEVQDRDGIDLSVRVGLNSGQVMPVRSVPVLWVTPRLASRSAWRSGWSRSPRRRSGVVLPGTT